MVPVDELRWIRIPGFNSESGSPVRVCYAAAWGPDVCRAGVVKRLMTDVESEGRMARLLVSVEDPLDLKTPQGERRPLILGGYVRVEIDGSTLPEVFRVRREHLRSGDTVWVMGPDDKLRIRDVTIAWSGSDDVCVRTGLSAGDRLVVSDLGAAVEGMMLRTAGSPASQAAEAPASQ